TAKGRSRTTALIALGAGAGLDGRWVPRVTGRDVVALGDGLGVRVGPPNERTVPLLATFEVDLQHVAQEHDAEFLLGGNGGKNAVARVARRFQAPPGIVTLSSPRLRNTWLVAHIRMGTRLPDLLTAAGVSTPTALDRLLGYVDPLPLSEA